MAPPLLLALGLFSLFIVSTHGQVRITRICESNIRFHNPNPLLECSHYVICDVYSRPYVPKCPQGLVYNKNMSYCDWPENVKECKVELQSTAVGNKLNNQKNATSTKCDASTPALCCEPNTRFRNPINCSEFILCDKFGFPHLFECPEGYLYNKIKSDCDLPEYVKECKLEEKIDYDYVLFEPDEPEDEPTTILVNPKAEDKKYEDKHHSNFNNRNKRMATESEILDTSNLELLLIKTALKRELNETDKKYTDPKKEGIISNNEAEKDIKEKVTENKNEEIIKQEKIPEKSGKEESITLIGSKTNLHEGENMNDTVLIRSATNETTGKDALGEQSFSSGSAINTTQTLFVDSKTALNSSEITSDDDSSVPNLDFALVNFNLTLDDSSGYDYMMTNTSSTSIESATDSTSSLESGNVTKS